MNEHNSKSICSGCGKPLADGVVFVTNEKETAVWTVCPKCFRKSTKSLLRYVRDKGKEKK